MSLSLRLSRWAMMSASVVLLSIPVVGNAQEDCSISGDRWNDVRLLLRCLAESGLGAWGVNESGRTVLHNAALLTSNPTIVVLLLEAGANPNARDDVGSTSLHLGAQNENPMVISHLLNAGGNPNGQNNEGHTPLHYAAGYNDNEQVILRLLAAGADLTQVDNTGWTALHFAVFFGQPRAISALIGTNGDTRLPALFTAVLRNDSLAVTGLIDDVDPRVTDGSGWSLLHYGASVAARPVVSQLLEAGVDPNLKTADGYSPLHFVTDPELISLFVAAGADIEARSRDGQTPLHYAALFRGPAVVEALLDAGADIRAENNDGDLPADLANAGVRDSAVYRRLVG